MNVGRMWAQAAVTGRKWADAAGRRVPLSRRTSASRSTHRWGSADRGEPPRTWLGVKGSWVQIPPSRRQSSTSEAGFLNRQDPASELRPQIVRKPQHHQTVRSGLQALPNSACASCWPAPVPSHADRRGTPSRSRRSTRIGRRSLRPGSQGCGERDGVSLPRARAGRGGRVRHRRAEERGRRRRAHCRRRRPRCLFPNVCSTRR